MKLAEIAIGALASRASMSREGLAASELNGTLAPCEEVLQEQHTEKRLAALDQLYFDLCVIRLARDKIHALDSSTDEWAAQLRTERNALRRAQAAIFKLRPLSSLLVKLAAELDIVV
jgi:hypothetical protein